jgi:apoptotic chromatin condensation inducer in the nucleus
MPKRNSTQSKPNTEITKRFEDIKRNISNTKEFIVEEGERINGTLIAFENKFEKILEDVKNESTANLTELKESFQARIDELQKRGNRLEEMIEEEKRERIEQNKKTHQEILNRLENLENGQLELNEKMITNVNELKQDLKNKEFILNEKIEKEKRERLEKEKMIKDELHVELEFQRKYIEDLQKKLNIEFNHVTTNIQKEVQHRLKEQDDILENLSKVVVTLQKTLDILGSN